MYPNRLVLSLCAALLALPALARDVDPPPVPEITIPRVTRAPKLSDFLNGTPREAEYVVNEFWQMDPDDGKPVTKPTTAYLSYDLKNLYCAFVVKDDPKLIRARVAKRKQIETDDRITINIDTMLDHRHAYWFDVNPYGVQLDGITTDGVGDDFSWEGLWYTDAKITADGYVVLITIPFRTLRFPKSERQTWGVVLGRFIQRNNEFAMWPWVSRRKLPQFVGQFGLMHINDNVSAGRNLQITPYAIGSESRFLDQPPGAVPFLHTKPDFRGGVDMKTVIRDSLVFDATVNPDFSQVESDEPQATVNQRYEVFFPELRPFFMENASYFTAPQQLFFSRRIADPQFGVRLTGKLGRWGIGALATDDRAPGKQVGKDDPNSGTHAKDAVLTLQRDLFTDSHVRLFITDTEFAQAYNRVASLDARFHLPHQFFLVGQAATSRDRTLANLESSGNDYYVALSHSDRHWQYSTAYNDISPDFRAALGYIPRTDIREVKNTLTYRWWRSNSVLIDHGPTFKVIRNWNRAGQVRDWEVDAGWLVELKNLTSLTYTHGEAYELYDGYGFRKRNDDVVFKTEWYKWMALSSQYTRGASINYYPAAGLAPFLGNSQYANVALTLRPRPKLQLVETYIFSQLTTRDAMPATRAGVAVYDNHIARSKMNYQFTREFSLRAIVDYNGVLPSAQLVSMERTKRLGYDILFTYLLHPGTALYAGYTDIYQNYRLNPMLPPYLTLSTAPDFNTGRQIFVKLSYQFRF